MRYPAEETAEKHERILDAASRLVRERGFDGIGVAELMKEAGLTHGAFYAHFESKEAMAAAALDRALADMLKLADFAISEGGDPLAAFANAYLTTKHRDNPGHGCAMATLGADVGRRGERVRRTFTTRVASLFKRLTGDSGKKRGRAVSSGRDPLDLSRRHGFSTRS
jgi:TetR/AcrR family transcriptional repressor of nem operon